MGRTYKRKANGQFAGSGGGTSGSRKVTAGRRVALGVLAQPKRQGNAPQPSNFQRAAFGVFAGRGRLGSRGRRILKKTAIRGVEAGVVIGAGSFANAVIKGNRIAASVNAGNKVRMPARSTSGTLTTVKAGRYQIPKASKTRSGRYRITTL